MKTRQRCCAICQEKVRFNTGQDCDYHGHRVNICLDCLVIAGIESYTKEGYDPHEYGIDIHSMIDRQQSSAKEEVSDLLSLVKKIKKVIDDLDGDETKDEDVSSNKADRYEGIPYKRPPVKKQTTKQKKQREMYDLVKAMNTAIDQG